MKQNKPIITPMTKYIERIELRMLAIPKNNEKNKTRKSTYLIAIELAKEFLEESETIQQDKNRYEELFYNYAVELDDTKENVKKMQKEVDELVKAMKSFTDAIESEQIIIQENFDNDGFENCGSRLYQMFKQLIQKYKR